MGTLNDLRDLAERQGTRSSFTAKLKQLCADHARKPTLIERLRPLLTATTAQ